MIISVEPKTGRKKRVEEDNEGGKTAVAPEKESHADHLRLEDFGVAL